MFTTSNYIPIFIGWRWHLCEYPPTIHHCPLRSAKELLANIAMPRFSLKSSTSKLQLDLHSTYVVVHLVPIYVCLYIYLYTVIHISSIYNRSIHMVLTFITHRIKLGCNPKWVNLPETLTENSEINVSIPQLLHEIEEMQTESLGKAMMQG